MSRSLIVLLLFSSQVLAQNWSPINDFPGLQRDDGAVFVIGDQAFCGTGFVPGGASSADFFVLDMTLDNWTSIAALPAGEERQYACGFSDGNSGFIFGGYNSGTFLGDIWQYDPGLNSWTEKTSIPAAARSAPAHFVIGDTCYFVGGKTAVDYAISEVWAYSMSADTWTPKGNFPYGARWRASGTASSDKGYILFGKDESHAYPQALYEYDPLTDSWTIIGDFPLPGRTHGALHFYNGDLLVIAGYDSLGNSYSDFRRFSLTDYNWTELQAIPAAGRRGGISFHNGIFLYYTTGINATNVRLKETWKNSNPTAVEEDQLDSVKLYPNPASSWVKFGNVVEGTLTVFTASGEVLFMQTIEGTISIDCSQWVSGNYFLEYSNGEQCWRGRLIVVP